MRRLLAASACCAALAAPAAARAETMFDAISLAYGSNPNLLAQRAEQRAIDEDYVQARSGLGPTVDFTADRTFQYNRTELSPNLAISRDGATSGVGLSINQPLFTGGRVSATMNVARANILGGRQTLRDTEQQVLSQAINAYVSVRRDLMSLEVAKDNLANVQQQMSDTLARYNAREATATDRAQAESRLAAAQSDLITAQGQLGVSRTAYVAAVGQSAGDLAPEPDLVGVPASEQEALGIADQDSPIVLAAQYRQLSSGARVQQAKAQAQPNISFNVLTDIGASSPYSAKRDAESVTARVIIQQPLFTGGLNASRVRQARQRSDSDEALVDAARRRTAQAVSQSWVQWTSQQKLRASNEERVRALRVAYEGAREEQRLGTRTTLDVLNQLQELQIARLSLVQSQANEYLSRVALLQAMGHLEADRLVPGIGIYNPNDYFNSVRGKAGLPLAAPVLESIDSLLAKYQRGPDAMPNLKKALRPRVD